MLVVAVRIEVVQVDKLEDFEVDSIVVAVATVLVDLDRRPAALDIAGLEVAAEQLWFAVAVVAAGFRHRSTFYTKSSSQSREAIGKGNLKMEISTVMQ